MALVGLKKLYAAKLLSDNEEGMVFSSPRYLKGVKEIGLKPKYNTEPFYAEDILWESETTLESIDVSIDVEDLTEEDENFLLGHSLDKNGGVIYKSTDVSPEVAILFKAPKSKGNNRYVILYRGIFSESDETYKGKEGKTEFQSKSLSATFAPTKNNDLWKYRVDSEKGMTDDKFFQEVYIPEKIESSQVPQNFNAEATENQVTLQWDLVGDAESYAIYKAKDEESAKKISTVIINKYIDTDVIPDSSYLYYVKSIKGGFESEASETKTVTIPSA